MKHLLARIGIAAVLALPILGAGQPLALAQTAPPNPTVTLTDGGFQPDVVNVAIGGTVTWVAQGTTTTHSATTQGRAPLPFDTGGIGAGQQASLAFGTAGTYHYTSVPDCANGNTSHGFACGTDYQVVVGGAAAQTPAPSTPAPAPVAPAAPAAPAPAAPAPATPAVAGVTPNPTVNISDTGISPASLTMAAGDTVTFVDSGTQVHTATSLGGAQQPFDTGGLGAGQTKSFSLSAVGNYSYTSAVDCTNKSNPPGFNCGPYTITVVAATPGTTTSSAPAPAASVAPAPSGQTAVTIDDTNGFTPQTLTVRVGQTVTWTNTGNATHTATSNPGYIPVFDTGGLSHNQSYSFTFTTAGTFGYHSQTEPQYYYNNPICTCTTTTYSFNGTIVVQ